MIAFIFWICVFLILYTYAFYPLLLGLMARLIPQSKPYEIYEPTVTLLIAAYNEKDTIPPNWRTALRLIIRVIFCRY